MRYEIWIGNKCLGEEEGITFRQACKNYFDGTEGFNIGDLTFWDEPLSSKPQEDNE